MRGDELRIMQESGGLCRFGQSTPYLYEALAIVSRQVLFSSPYIDTIGSSPVISPT